MSNQFYKYIATRLVTYFNEEAKLKKGDRFYLQLDNKEEVRNLIDAIQSVVQTEEFIYTHEFGDEYRTFCIRINNLRLVVAYTSENVKPDFLVTLRNQVGEQKGIWENTALFSIVSEQLDSIQGGSSDLQKEGMPLHPNSIFKKLKEEIDSTIKEIADKKILLDNLEHLLQDQQFHQTTFFDFEDIFDVMAKGSLEDEDYKKFGLFRDPDLITFTGNKLKERMEKNRELYEYVKKVHDYGLSEDMLDKKFSSNGVPKLKQENWQELSFSEVYRYEQEKIEVEKDNKVDFKEVKELNRLTIWDKPYKETSSGKRKRHIIVFNPNQEEIVQIQASFELGGKIKSLSPAFISSPKKEKLNFSVGRTNLTIKIETMPNKPTFAKVTYKHDKKVSLGAEFNIVVLPVDSMDFEHIKTKYLVDIKLERIEIQSEEEKFSIGNGNLKRRLEVTSNHEEIHLEKEEMVEIYPQPDAFDDEEQLFLQLTINKCNIPLLIKNEAPESTPITGLRIWRLKREMADPFKLINNRLVIGNREYYIHPEYKDFISWEKEWVKQTYYSADLDSGVLSKKDIHIHEDLREAYSRFINYFRINQNIPSLSYLTEEYKKRAIEYVKEFNKQIQSMQEGKEAGQKGRDLMNLGVITSNSEIYITPFHPLMAAYQLTINELLGNEEVDGNILSRLKPDGLLPYIYYSNDELYKPDNQNNSPEWLVYKPVNQVTVSDASQYLSKVIEDKIKQFEEHFTYLFIKSSNAPLQINVINISNDREVLRGIVNWMTKGINEYGPEGLKPIEVTLYGKNGLSSAFDEFSRTENIEEIKIKFDLRLKTENYEEQDVLRFVREKLFYYKQSTEGDYRYSHITFYKMNAHENYALQPMSEMITGISLRGLYTTVPSMKAEENYRNGFGIKAYEIEENDLLTYTAYNLNELAGNLRNDGNDSYRKGEAIVARTTTADEETLDKIFQSSYWVTFVDPSVDLEFFNEYGKNLVVIHYSDQYSSSSRYDAITVTIKSEQYYAVISEFLASKGIESTEENVKNTIKGFNTFNGEWLLRIIGSKGQYSREKLSIISAIKYSLAYFDHPNILWVPISLEEILRVAGAVSLSKAEGIFTAKNLGVKGSHSDDLLLIGLETVNDELKMHFYPVEVKIGINSNQVLDKAKDQIKNTKQLLISALEKINSHMQTSFKSLFYRNFFAQLFISNAKKIAQSGFWEEKDYQLSEKIIEKLLKDQYFISLELETIIGKGAIMSFQKDAYHRSSYLDDSITIVNLTEFDGYYGLVKPIESLKTWIQEGKSDFVAERLLSYNYREINRERSNVNVVTDNLYPEKQLKQQDYLTTSNLYSLETGGQQEAVEEEVTKSYEEKVQDLTEIDAKLFPHPSFEEENGTKETKLSDTREQLYTTENKKNKLEEARILIGTASNSNKKIYWEYGHKDLANRHLLISGKSGQGKTYFMQCLLLEKSKLGIPSIVIDYTEGFLPNQLEPEFVEYLGPKLKQTIVFTDKFPINPFKKNERIIGDLHLPETDTDVAERIKSVFAAVYKTLGIQQLNAIYEATLSGLNKYGDNMNLVHLKDELEILSTNNAKSAVSQIRPLIDRNPFSSESTIDWREIVDSDGEVFIIQLTGYPRDVQLMITEFILWDLWNYSVRHGNKNKPMPVILDEAQNLDHTEKSPSARILQEGRKFGWSAWYATQFLKSQLEAEELARLQNASQKVYFSPPEQEISNIASSLSQDGSEKKQWESRLAGLKKGQCIVHGPVLSDSGQLSKPIVTIVDITPLSERI
jgi:DNA phosphorothioation-dependent restriction protein DptH